MFTGLPTLAFTVPPSAVWLIFGVTMLATVAASAVLIYHWDRFGHGASIPVAKSTYILGALVLVTLIFFAVIRLYATLS